MTLLPFFARDRVDVLPNGCWAWLGYLNSDGYGVAAVPCSCGEATRRPPAHRLMYETHVGPIPDGLQIDHLCRNRECVNPAHMEAVSSAENTLRGSGPSALNARKTHCVHGHPLSGDNLYIEAGKKRKCRQCNRDKNRRYQARRRAAEKT